MIWLVLRFVPLGAILRVLLMAGAVGMIVIGMSMSGVVSAQETPTASDCEAIKNTSEDAYEECLAATGGNSSSSASSQDSNGSAGSVLFSHSKSVDLHSVELQNGVAIVTMSSQSGGEQVVITDSSRETSGEMERYRHNLTQGTNTFRVPLHNSDNPAVTVDSAGSIYLWVGDTSLNWTPDPGNAVPLVIGGGLIVLILIAGLHLVQTRGQTTAENPIR